MIKIIYISAPWCGPCKMYGPIVENFAKLHPEVEVEKISLDGTNDSIAIKYNIRAVPHTLFLVDDKVVVEHSGSKSLSFLEKQLDLCTF